MSNENVYASESTPDPRAGMSGTSKVLLVFGLGCGFLLLLMCAGIIAVGYWLKGMQSTDAAEIRQLTDQIVSIEIPQGFKPQMAWNFKMPMATDKSFVVVLYGDDNGHLSLAQIAGAGDEATVEQMRLQMDASLSQQTNRDGITVEKTDKHDVEIHGKPAHFTITTGKTKEGKEVREAKGDFLGSNGPALFLFVGDGAEFSEDAVIHLLDSMK